MFTVKVAYYSPEKPKIAERIEKVDECAEYFSKKDAMNDVCFWTKELIEEIKAEEAANVSCFAATDPDNNITEIFCIRPDMANSVKTTKVAEFRIEDVDERNFVVEKLLPRKSGFPMRIEVDTYAAKDEAFLAACKFAKKYKTCLEEFREGHPTFLVTEKPENCMVYVRKKETNIDHDTKEASIMAIYVVKKTA